MLFLHPLIQTYMCTHTHTHTYSPEGLGVVSAAVFLIIMFLFTPFPFLNNLINPAHTQYIQVRGTRCVLVYGVEVKVVVVPPYLFCLLSSISFLLRLSYYSLLSPPLPIPSLPSPLTTLPTPSSPLLFLRFLYSDP